ncbi:diaminopimelate decarboxylase [bacterium]|nr:diaminopimelate decarboxylase [bacterium]MBU1753788.1 diaminopimelate decarboxylase [bacterium]
MPGFEYVDDELCCDSASISKIASKVKTPFYLYSHDTLKKNYQSYTDAFQTVDLLVCYACKANSNLSILRALGNMGSGMDVLSYGELFRALKAGISPEKIVFNGNGKTSEEMAYALQSGVFAFNVDSQNELFLLNEVAKANNIVARIALRVNPDINPLTHPYVATGLAKSKFGVPIHEAKEVYRTASTLENISVVGIHSHIGSQLSKVELYLETLKKIMALVKELHDIHIHLEFINLGGGIGIPYQESESMPHPKDLSTIISPLINDYRLILEPGRSIVGPAGVLVTRVLYIKHTHKKNFIVVDAGMNDLIRPSIYGAYHHVISATRHSNTEEIMYDIVGPICEEGDFIARERYMPRVKQGDLLIIKDAGAYGFSMSSNYNSRPRVSEVMVMDGKDYIIREREVCEDMICKESIPDILKEI